MQITVNFDPETLALLDAATDSYNAAAGTNLTRNQYLAREIEAAWEQKRQASIIASANALTAAVMPLSKEARDEVIAFIQAKVAEQS